MKTEIRFTLVDNENWLLANLYPLISISRTDNSGGSMNSSALFAILCMRVGPSRQVFS